MSGALLGAKTSKWHVNTDLLEPFCYSVRRRAQSPERQNWTLAPRRSPSVSTLEPLHEPGTTITVVEFCAKGCAGGQVTLRSHSPSLATMGDRSQHATLVLTLRIAIENSLSRNASPSLYTTWESRSVPCNCWPTTAVWSRPGSARMLASNATVAGCSAQSSKSSGRSSIAHNGHLADDLHTHGDNNP